MDQPKPQKLPADAIRTEVKQAQEAWLNAAVSMSSEAYERLMCPSFFCVMQDGRLIRKDEFLLSVQTANRKIQQLELTECDIDVFDSSAVVCAIAKFKATIDGIPFDGPVRITAFWVNIDSQWKCVCYHLSDLRKQFAFESLRKK